MKKINYIRLQKSLVLFFMMNATSFIAQAQGFGNGNEKKPSIALVDFDCSGYVINPLQVRQYVINELIRIEKFQVIDRHEVEYIAEIDSLNPIGCFSRPCLTIFGKKMKVDYMFTGDLIKMGDYTNISLKLLNVSTGEFEKMKTQEFLLIPGSEMAMLRVSINEMFGIANDAETVKKLTIRSDFDNTLNNPYKLRLRNDGPRMGFVFVSGLNGEILKDKKGNGGFESAYAGQFQFGYQFEKQYLNEGNFQALFEFIPNISGIDQGRLIPSFTFLNGLRNNKNGWEFGIGPTITISKIAEGFYDSSDNNKWKVRSENLNPNNYDIESRLDSRGESLISTGLVIAVGKTFKSGKMNFPFNAFIIPNKNGMRFGLSFGWNGRPRMETTRRLN